MTQETQPQTISGVFAYAKIQEPAFKYQSTTEKEFSIDIIVDKATAKAFGKQFRSRRVNKLITMTLKKFTRLPLHSLIKTSSMF